MDFNCHLEAYNQKLLSFWHLKLCYLHNLSLPQNVLLM